MQLLLSLFILIGVTQRGDSTQNIKLSPDNYVSLGVPSGYEFVIQYKTTVTTAYLTSVECMLSKNMYIESGFASIDTRSLNSQNVMTEVKSGIESFNDLASDLQINDYEKDAKATTGAVEYMTLNYYMEKDALVKKPEVTLSTVTDIKQAEILLTASRCKSAYTKFENDATAIQKKYNDGSNNNRWDDQAKQYYEAREEIVNLQTVYTSIKDAFLLANGISMCEGSAKPDQSLLDIYNTEDLSSYFGIKDNDASALLYQTVTKMYSVYKASLTTIYLKSVVYTDCDLAMRVTEWEQLNLVRANFEFQSQRIESFITTIQKDAKNSYGVESAEYKEIMTVFFTTVNSMLLTVVKSTEVTYTRAMNFNTDGTMMKTDYNKLKINVINNFFSEIPFSYSNTFRYDLRVVNNDVTNYPSKEEGFPQNMYPLLINTLFFQGLITIVQYLFIQLQLVKPVEKTVEFWIQEKITLTQLEYSIIFSKCAVKVNKVLTLNTATFTNILMKTDNSFQPTDVQIYMNQVSNDIIGKISVNTLEITGSLKIVDVFLVKNSPPITESVPYKPRTISQGSNNVSNQPSGSTSSPPPQSNTGSPPPQSNTGSPPPESYTGSPPPQSNTGTPPPQSNTGTPPPQSNTGTPPPQSNTGSPPVPGDSGNNSISTSITYTYITNGEQITKTIDLFSISFNKKINLTITYVKNEQETDYTKIVLLSLEFNQKVFQRIIDYLKWIVLDSLQYITQVTVPNSNDFFNALQPLYSDTTEKLGILCSTMEIPFKRATSYSLTSTQYINVSQTIIYSQYVKNVYSYFDIKFDEVDENKCDADLFLTISLKQFTNIFSSVIKEVEKLSDELYKNFLYCYLTETLAMYTEIIGIFKELTVQMQPFISKNENNKFAYYQELVQQIESINVICSSIIIKSFDYTQRTSTTTIIPIYESEYEIVVKSKIVTTTSYTEIQTTEIQTAEIQTAEIQMAEIQTT